MVMKGSSVSEDEPLLENWTNDLQGLYGQEQPASLTVKFRTEETVTMSQC